MQKVFETRLILMISNIYDGKNYRYFLVVPLIIFVISVVFFIPKIQLDSTLKGGISIQLETNASVNVQSLTSIINSKIPGAQASVSKSPGGISITIAVNTSISDAQTAVLNIFALQSNYSQSQVNITSLQNIIKKNPSNTTAIAQLAKENASSAKYVSKTNAALSSMLASIKPFLGNNSYPYNSTNEQNMVNVAQEAESQALINYKSEVLAVVSGAASFSSYSYNYVTPTLGAFFLKQMTDVLIAAFVLVAITAFVIFRNPIPSFAVVFGAVSDIVVALGAMGAFGIPLGVASIGGLLMLVGYSMDTDMLSAIRILKRKDGTASERAWSSMKTGLTMTTAAVISFLILLIISYITFIPTYFEISTIVLFGLLADVLTTWFINVPITLWYKHRKDAHGHN